MCRIALANLTFPRNPSESVSMAIEAIAAGASAGAEIICFPECFTPGYRVADRVPPPDMEFLQRAWDQIAAAAGRNRIAVVLGAERMEDGQLLATALVINNNGTLAGFQDKVQIDPSEEGLYTAGIGGRKVFQAGDLKFGIVICHEGWRYPETVRAAARQGAQVVFHPQFAEAERGSFRPTR